MTDKGAVVVIQKQSFNDAGEKLVNAYEVRHGVRTVGEYTSRSRAEEVAKVIAG